MACLPPVGLDVTGKPLVVSGWGLETYNPTISLPAPPGQYPPTLKQTTLYGISNEACIVGYDNTQVIGPEMLCVFSRQQNTAECKGDSGGKNNKNLQIL